MLLKNRPKLAFFDIDGTLIGKSGTISDRTIEALKRLRSKGIEIALATGRPMFGAKNISSQLDIDCFSLFSSGALIANPRNNQILFEAEISPSLITKCVNSAKKLGLYIELYTANNYYVEKETILSAKHTSYLGSAALISDFNKVISEHAINKIVTISDNPELDLKQNILIQELPELVCLCSKGASHPEIMFNNITSQSANRHHGFHLIANKMNISAEEIIAFGDAKSDLTFIDLAGFGVAMEEAPQEVKEKANYIAESANKDGLATVLEKILEEIT